MSKSAIGLVALNVFTLMMAVVGLTAQHEEPMSMALVLALCAMLANSGWLIRNGTREPSAEREAAPARTRTRRRRTRKTPVVDEMDPRTVLDIDARLEALERREREQREAERIQQMVDRGQQSAPAAPLANNVAPEAARERA